MTGVASGASAGFDVAWLAEAHFRCAELIGNDVFGADWTMALFALHTVLQMETVVEEDEILQSENAYPGNRLLRIHGGLEGCEHWGRLCRERMAFQTSRCIGNAHGRSEFFRAGMAIGALHLYRANVKLVAECDGLRLRESHARGNEKQ